MTPDARPSTELRCEKCKHPLPWHSRHGCNALSSTGACECKDFPAVVDLMDALRQALPRDENPARLRNDS